MRKTNKLLLWLTMVSATAMLICALTSTALAVEADDTGIGGAETTEASSEPTPTPSPEPITRDVTLVRTAPVYAGQVPDLPYIFLSDIGYTGTETELTIPETVTTYDGDQEYINRIVAVGYNGGSYTTGYGSTVTYQGDYTFQNNQNLTSVTLPATLTKGVYEGAFQNCDNLTMINVNCNLVGRNIFRDCDGLASVDLPESVTDIKNAYYLFAECDNLETFALTGATIELPQYMFYNCNKITTAVIPEGVLNIGTCAFAAAPIYEDEHSLTNVTLPESLYTIGNYAFEYCRKLTSITLPAELRVIGPGAFSYCSLETINIPDNVKMLDSSTFYSNPALKTVTVGTGVDYVGTYCFAQCPQLSRITFATNKEIEFLDGAFSNTGFVDGTCFTKAKRFGASCFQNCQQMTSFVFDHPVNASEIYTYVSDGRTHTSTRTWTYAIAPSLFRGCRNLASVTLPDKLISIQNYAFADCTSLTGLNVPDTVTAFGEYIVSGDNFDGDTFHFPSAMTTLNSYSLADWPGVTSITVPANITELGQYCFTRDKNLVNCTFLADYIHGGKYTFAYCDSLAGPGVKLPDYHNFFDETLYPDLTVSERKNYQAWNEAIPDSFFASCTGLKTYDVPAHITYIQHFAFGSCPNLTTLNLPNGIEYLGRYMVSGCDSLRSVDLPESLSMVNTYAFAGWTGVQEVTFPPHITSIDNGGFYNCPNLVTVDLPETVERVGIEAFSRCTSLKTVNFPASITLSGGAFSLCTALEELHLPQIGDTIPYELCEGDVQLKTVTIPEGVKTIQREAFNNCERLDNVVLPSTLETINSCAFQYCCSIRYITIPASVTMIANRTFNNAHNLDRVTFVPNENREIADRVFQGTHFVNKPSWSTGNPDFADTEDFEIADGHLIRYRGVSETVIVPDGVKYIVGGAFAGNTTAKTIVLPDSVVSLGTNAFYNTRIEEINIPRGVTVIPQECFGYCSQLTKCILPDTITTIGHGAFTNDVRLSLIIPNSVTSANIGIQAFHGIGSVRYADGSSVYFNDQDPYPNIY